MKEGPDISIVASLMGDPARANMLMAMMARLALTATELAHEAGVGLPTASVHLAKLQQAGLIAVERQGRHRYFRLSGADVVAALEGLLPLAARVGHLRTRTGPRDAALRRARSCYDHLAGDLAVRIFDHLINRRVLIRNEDGPRISNLGRRFFTGRGINIAELEAGRRPLCHSCLDWSERRSHLGGSLGAALFDAILQRRWVTRQPGTRVVRFGRMGEQPIMAWLTA